MPPNLQTVDMLNAGKNLLCVLFIFASQALCYAMSMHWQMVAFALTFSLTVTLNPMYTDVIPVPEPCLDSFVFLRVKERQENILVDPETDDQRYISFELLSVFPKPTRWQCHLFTFSTVTFLCIDSEITNVISALSLPSESMLWILKRALSI